MGNVNHSDNGTFVVKKNKNSSILAFIGCLVLAFVIWVYVMNVTISDNSKTFTIKMDVRGESTLLNEKNYSIFGGSETWVKVTVQGTNAAINKCSEKDFGVYIDVSDIENTGMNPINIVVECKSTSISVVSTDPMQTTVFVDERVSDRKVPLHLDIEGASVDSNVSVNVNTDVVSVSGPKMFVDEIAYARIVVSTTDIVGGDENSAYKVEFPVEFYDVAHNVVKSSYLSYNSTDIAVTVDQQIELEENK